MIAGQLLNKFHFYSSMGGKNMKKAISKLLLSFAIAALLALPTTAFADTPQISPIQWDPSGSLGGYDSYDTDYESATADCESQNCVWNISGTTYVSGIDHIDIDYNYYVQADASGTDSGNIWMDDSYDGWSTNLKAQASDDYETNDWGTHTINVSGYSGPIDFYIDVESGQHLGNVAYDNVYITAYDANGNVVPYTGY
jgi:hypothetical protein